MKSENRGSFSHQRVELDGVGYVILRESAFLELCQRAGIAETAAGATEHADELEADLDRATLAARLIRRRRAVGLTQLQLARRAGIRPETLNRIERGRTTPDFATVRKIVVAMNTAEREAMRSPQAESQPFLQHKHAQ